MGIDKHAFNLLRYAKKHGAFGNTVTIGRQGVHLSDDAVRLIFRLGHEYKCGQYCEKLLCDNFGATTVDSIDNSAYEHATIVYDMNKPLPPHNHGLYDTVIDGGCLEHIYNISQALANCSLLCRQGGQIVHILPASNFCGHGFWQFSPELFFSLYSTENGYQNTEVFLASVNNTMNWYRVNIPPQGERINIFSLSSVYVLVRTVLSRRDFSHTKVQQSDYAFLWDKAKEDAGQTRSAEADDTHQSLGYRLREFVRTKSQLSSLYHSYLPYLRTYMSYRKAIRSGLSRKNHYLSECVIDDLL